MKKPSEAAVLAACLELLRVRGVVHWRSNAGGTYYERAGGGRRYVRFNTPGISDILCVLSPGGRLLAVECKSATGKLTAEQTAFQEAVRREGGQAVVIRDVLELQAILDREV